MPLSSRPKALRSLRPRAGTPAPRPRPARARRATTADPITTEIILGAFETICYEMATHVSLTATTPILNQSNERNATILDGTGQLAALSVGIPQFMLSSTLPVRFAVEFFGDGGLFDGDVLVANDPYHGGGHLPDYNIFAPVFHDGACVLIASIQCHHADTGGGAPGGYNVNAPDIWAEGVRFPAVKIYEKGVKRRDVEYMMAVNNRTPTFLGDLRAQVGAAQLGVARLKEVLARFGPSTVEAAVRGIIAYAKRRFREEVARWPDGVYESDAYVDHDPHGKKDIHVHCRVTVKGSDLTVDFTGSDDRPDIQAYSTFGNTRGYVVAQLASMMDPKIPKNEGFFDSIDLIVPRGCCLNPPGHRGRRGGRQGARARGPRAELTAGLQDGDADRHLRHQPARREDVHRPFGGYFCRVLRRREGPGRLGRDERLLREPDPGHGRDQRVDLPDPPALARLRDRHGWRGRVPRQLRQPLPQAGARARHHLHLCRRQAVPDAGHRGREAGLAQPPHRPRGRRARFRGGGQGRLHRARGGRVVRVSLRRRRRLGRSPRAAGRGGPRGRARRIRLGRGRTARLRGRADRLARGPDAGRRPRGDGAPAGRAARGPE